MTRDALPVCRFDELADPGSRAVTVPLAAGQQEAFVVRCGDRVFAYLNRCPHTGAPLDWMPGQFLSLDQQHIQCAMHCALFRIDDGKCLAGPCEGASLTPVKTAVVAGDVLVLAGQQAGPA